ncbi:MAG TPA: PQQ-binding-like beta-propeller repeat protein [Rhizomicrobium sp.]|nr:PQQ-binding-like beta-propeller repeat protein [Rhizomicrobium sp.]
MTMHSNPIWKVAMSGAALALLAGTAYAAGGTDWRVTGHDAGGERYSPLTQITKDNVNNLQQAWSFHLKPDGYTGRLRRAEGIPLVVNDTMYVNSPYGQVIALDATTGKEKWRYDLPQNEAISEHGSAYWPGGEGAPPSIIFGTMKGHLISIRASDGKPNAAFGDHGMVNMKTPEVMQTGPDGLYLLPSAPVIYKNLVITGAGSGEGPGGSRGGDGPSGDTRAWDAKTGKLVWTFHSVPGPGEPGYDTWGKGSTKNRSGVNVWGYMTVDQKRGIVYMPFGAPNNDRVGVDRPGNNLYSSSLVAADANTGKYLWHFQVVHHDVWDYDTQDPPVLADIKHDGKTVPAVLFTNKNALLFILNRVTGKPIFPVEERPVPQSDVPGEQTSATQPFPVKPEPLSQNTLSRDNLYKGEPEHQAYCEHLVDDNQMKLGGPYLPPGFNQYTVSPPGTQGGVNFWGGSYDPKLGLFITNVNNLFQPMHVIMRPDKDGHIILINEGPLAGVRRFWDAAKHLPCGPTPWGQLVAVNVETGDIAWRKTLGETDSFPAQFRDTGRPGTGGTILTASGLTFVGATDDFRFRAFDTATGDKLWEIKLPASVEATPVTYRGADGRQFVAVVDTGGSQIGSVETNDEVIAFAAPKK